MQPLNLDIDRGKLRRLAMMLVKAWGTQIEASRRSGLGVQALRRAIANPFNSPPLTVQKILAAERAARAEIERQEWEDRQDPDDRDCGLCGQPVQLGMGDPFASCNRCGRGIDRSGRVVAERHFGPRRQRRKVAR
jgi:hypothetical protein